MSKSFLLLAVLVAYASYATSNPTLSDSPAWASGYVGKTAVSNSGKTGTITHVEMNGTYHVRLADSTEMWPAGDISMIRD